jgi:uncharacterized protein YdaU (DUF1376 family)
MTSPSFQFYADDFLGGTADMTQNEVGAYILLLCQQWNRGSIPLEPERQKLMAKGEVSEHVLAKFKLKNGKLCNARMEKTRAILNEYREKQRKNGLASGISRRNHRSTTVQPPFNQPLNQTATTTPTKTNSPVSSLQSPVSYKEGECASRVQSSEIAEVFDAWNGKAKLPQCLVVSDKRRQSLKARLNNPFFKSNWRAALEKVVNSPFCRGETESGDWKASFDWFITPDAVLKIMEGKYDSKEPQRKSCIDTAYNFRSHKGGAL